MAQKRVLVAGASGYLGSFVTQELLDRGYDTTIIVRDSTKVSLTAPALTITQAHVTKPDTLHDVCKNIDVVISSVGITRQREGLSYMDVDYQANVNLIDEAKKSGVKKFIYISVLNGERLRNIQVCDAKEKLVDYLKASGLDFCIVRPNGFFSDMANFITMARKGKIHLFGDGTHTLNPIHGSDLAHEIVNAIDHAQRECAIGGPNILTQNEIAALAFKAIGKDSKIIHLPDWIRTSILWCIQKFMPPQKRGPIEFFMTVMGMNMTAPRFGTKRLENFFVTEAKKSTDNE